jgi:hypothetical protein
MSEIISAIADIADCTVHAHIGCVQWKPNAFRLAHVKSQFAVSQ